MKTSSIFVFAIFLIALFTLNAEPQTSQFNEIQEIFPSDVNPIDVSWQFGGTVSISGDTVLVGAIHAEEFMGQAYIFDKNNATGLWEETQILTGSNVMPGDFFGNCVHIDGNTAIVGATHVLNGGQGEAYVFERDPVTNVWSEVDVITGSTGGPSDFYGISCSVDESTGIAMVGANRAGGLEGRAYVYERDMLGMWNEVQVLVPSGGSPLFNFGIKLSLHEDTSAVGASGGERVYIYNRNEMGVWNESQILTASDGMVGNSFGVDVDFSGDNMVIGASQFNMNQGKAYIFERDMNGFWSEVQILTAPMPVIGEFFGSNVTISGNTAVIGASLLNTTPGRAFVYKRDPFGMWPEAQELTASNGMPGDFFGVEVSLDGNQLIVGASGVDGAAGTNTGAAYLYESPPPVVRNVPTLSGWAFLLLAIFLGSLAVYTIRMKRRCRPSA